MNIIFAGTPGFAASHLEGLLSAGISIQAVVTQPDKPGKRGKKLVPSDVKLLAEKHGLPVLQPTKFQSEDIAGYSPDLLIVVAYGQILRQSLLDTPTLGCINVHGSILPRWRGAAPIQRAVEAGDEQTGICIMQMDAGLDTGAVLHESRLPLTPAQTSGDVSDELVKIGIEGLIKVLGQIEAGTTNPVAQSEQNMTYASKIEKSEARIDWSRSSIEIVRKIHAFNPEPTSYCELIQDDKVLRMKVHRAQLGNQLTSSNQEDPSRPDVDASLIGTSLVGTILKVEPEGIEVATQDGSVLLKSIQLPLGKGSILTGRDVMNARADILHAGVRLT